MIRRVAKQPPPLQDIHPSPSHSHPSADTCFYQQFDISTGGVQAPS